MSVNDLVKNRGLSIQVLYTTVVAKKISHVGLEPTTFGLPLLSVSLVWIIGPTL